MWTFPPTSLYSFLSFLYQRPQLPWEEMGPPKQDFWKVSFLMLINLCGARMNTWRKSAFICLGIQYARFKHYSRPWNSMASHISIWIFRGPSLQSSCWMVEMRPTCGPVPAYKGPSSHIWIAIFP